MTGTIQATESRNETARERQVLADLGWVLIRCSQSRVERWRYEKLNNEGSTVAVEDDAAWRSDFMIAQQVVGGG